MPPSMEFKNQTQKAGPKPQVGQYVYYDMLVTCNDVIVKSTYTGAGYAKAKFADVSGEDASPAMIALKSMAVGDSTTILVKGDKYIEQLRKTFYPDAFGDVKYQIVLRAIKSEKEYLQDMEVTRKGMEKRLQGAIPKNNNREVVRPSKPGSKK